MNGGGSWPLAAVPQVCCCVATFLDPAEAAAPDLQTPAAAAAAAVGLKVKVTRMASTTAIKVAPKPSKPAGWDS